MSLIDCDECEGKLSKTAKSCPHCGAEGPFPNAERIAVKQEREARDRAEQRVKRRAEQQAKQQAEHRAEKQAKKQVEKAWAAELARRERNSSFSRRWVLLQRWFRREFAKLTSSTSVGAVQCPKCKEEHEKKLKECPSCGWNRFKTGTAEKYAKRYKDSLGSFSSRFYRRKGLTHSKRYNDKMRNPQTVGTAMADSFVDFLQQLGGCLVLFIPAAIVVGIMLLYATCNSPE